MINIAVDAMGGDHAPSAIVDGAVAAVRRKPGASKAVRNAIAMAYRFVTGGCIHRVEREIAAASVSPH